MPFKPPRNASPRKQRALALSHEFVIPGRVEIFHRFGLHLVIGRREGYRIWDVDGHELMDLHLNGGTFNLGHRHPAVVGALRDALDGLDIGNHHFASEARATLAEKLAAATGLHYTVFASGGSEAIDVAIKSARYFTGRRKIVGIEAGYHGRTGLSGAAGNDGTARYFHSDYPDEFLKVPFDDASAMAEALADNDVAAVLMETIPATSGFPIPSDDYLPAVKALCERHGALYVADEVQTGLGRTGRLWGIANWGVQPDILITGKGLSGGLYPIAAAVLRKEVGAWLADKGWGHVSTFGGAELGCQVASTVLDLCGAPETLANVAAMAERLGAGLRAIQRDHPYLLEIRQKGLVFGLKFDGANGGLYMTRALFEAGIWAMFAGFDPSVIQFKPGLLVDEAYCDEALERFETAIRMAEGLPDPGVPLISE